MYSEFTAAFFTHNRAQLRQAMPDQQLFVITANGLLQRNADSTMPFRQDSNFWYLTGISEPDVLLVMEAEREYLIIPPRDDVRAAFDGAVDETSLQQVSGVAEVLPEAEGWQRLQRAVARHKQVASCETPPAYDDRHGMYINPSRFRLLARLRESAGLAVHDVRPALMRLRSLKQAPELAAIRQAINTTIEGLRYVTDPEHRLTYRHEYEVEADLTASFNRRQGSGHAYTPIVAGGLNGCVLHYLANRAPLKANQLLLMDVGAEVSNYAADLTRTVRLRGEPTKRQQAVFEAVAAIQDHALTLLRPGTMLRDYEQEVERFTGEQLIRLGVIDKADSAAIRRYYPHSASHFMGLDVHDVGDYSEPLQAGMVLTCEPGIYITEEAIGIRLEDDVLITETGNEVLSARLPRSLS